MSRFIVTTLGLLMLIVVAIITPLTTSAQEPTRFYWEFINVDINVQENGDILITETQKYVFNRHHLGSFFRRISMNKVDSIDNIEVTEEGEILSIATEIKDNQLDIRWQREVNPGENHTFVLKYIVHGGLRVIQRNDELKWTVLRKDLPAEVKSTRVTVWLPASLSGPIRSTKSFGIPTDIRMVNDQTIEFISRGPAPPGRPLSVSVTFPGLTSTSVQTQAILSVSIALSVLAALVLLKRKRPSSHLTNGARLIGFYGGFVGIFVIFVLFTRTPLSLIVGALVGIAVGSFVYLVTFAGETRGQPGPPGLP